jgi:hypothetical protein
VSQGNHYIMIGLLDSHVNRTEAAVRNIVLTREVTFHTGVLVELVNSALF